MRMVMLCGTGLPQKFFVFLLSAWAGVAQAVHICARLFAVFFAPMDGSSRLSLTLVLALFTF